MAINSHPAHLAANAQPVIPSAEIVAAMQVPRYALTGNVVPQGIPIIMMASVIPNRVPLAVHPVPLPVHRAALPAIKNILRVRDTAAKRDIPIITTVPAISVQAGIIRIQQAPGTVVRRAIPFISMVHATSARRGIIFLQTVPGNVVLRAMVFITMVSATSARWDIMCLRRVPGNVVRMVILIIMTVRATTVPAGILRIQQAPGTVVLRGIPTTGTGCVIQALRAAAIPTTIIPRIPTARRIPPAIRRPIAIMTSDTIRALTRKPR